MIMSEVKSDRKMGAVGGLGEMDFFPSVLELGEIFLVPCCFMGVVAKDI